MLIAAIGLCAAFSVAHPAYGMLSGSSSSGASAEWSANTSGTQELLPQATPDIPDFSPPASSVERPPLYEAPRAIRAEDHFYLTRPIQSGYHNWPIPYYRYGSTMLGRDPLHTGVDMAVAVGTPIVAAGSGNVIWAGYGFKSGVYDPDDAYGLAIAIQHDFGYMGLNLYTVYGHLSSLSVWPGQRVEMGQVIGQVGSTGMSSGPHLHFEVRHGDRIYSTTRNPELWMTMPEGWGVLAGSLQDDWGRNLHEEYLRIVSLETSKRWDLWTYATDTLGPDLLYDENFAIGDLPAGRYELTIDYRWRLYTVEIDILPGRTNFIAFRGQSGFFIEPELEASDTSQNFP